MLVIKSEKPKPHSKSLFFPQLTGVGEDINSNQGALYLQR